MPLRLQLPDDKELLAKACSQMLDDALRVRSIVAVEWAIVRHYLQGCRYFEAIEYASGLVRPAYKDSMGGIPFKYEELLSRVGTEIGRLLRLDTDPAVIRRSMGLDGLRRESTGQALFDAINPHLLPEETKRQVMEHLVHYGFTGLLAIELSSDEVDEQKTPAALGLEVIPPWELLLLPASARSPTEISAAARQRWVPLDLLRDMKFDGKKPEGLDPSDKRKREDLQIRELPLGATVSGTKLESLGEPTQHMPSRFIGGKSKDKDTVPFVRLSEVWVPFPNGRLHRYIVMAGRVLIHDKKWSNKPGVPMMPLGTAVKNEGVGAYGRGFTYPLIPVNQEIEAAVLNLLRNIQDIDLMGLIGIPVSWNVTEEDLQAAIGGRKYFWVDKDPSRPNETSESIQPVTSGNLPKDVINLGLTLLDRLCQQPEIVTQGEAPGRVDSRVALDFLYQASTLPLGQLASSISSCYSTVYKALLGYAGEWPNIQLNLDTLRDDSVIGIVFNYTTGNMELSKNAVPDPLQVNVGIRSQKPVNKQDLENKLMGLLSQNIISQKQFRLTARIKGLDFPLLDDVEWQNYRMANLRNIILFNDGTTPGDITQMNLSPYDDPEIHLMVVNKLMASPEFAMSHESVQQAFVKLVDLLQGLLGRFPDQLPQVEDLLGGGEGGEMGGGLGEGGGMGMPGMEEGAGNMQSALQSLSGVPAGGPLPQEAPPS